MTGEEMIGTLHLPFCGGAVVLGGLVGAGEAGGQGRGYPFILLP